MSDYSDLDDYDSLPSSLEEEECDDISMPLQMCGCGKAHSRQCPFNPCHLGKPKVKFDEAHGKGKGVAPQISTKGRSPSPDAKMIIVSRRRGTPSPKRARFRSKLPFKRSPSSKWHRCSPSKRLVWSRKRLIPSECDTRNVSPDVRITAVVPHTSDIVVNPPDQEWISKAMGYLHNWSKVTIDAYREADQIMVEDSVAPHLVDTIVGDGHCLFRAIAKIITGSQTNHGAVRQAVVQWMLCKEHPPELAKRVAEYAKAVMSAEIHQSVTW